MSNPKKPNLVGTGVQKGLLKTPVYDAEFFEQPQKRQRGLGFNGVMLIAFVALVMFWIVVLGLLLT